MLSGCLQRAVCSDPLSSDIREKSDGPTTSAGSAFRNFVLDRASYDETHGTEHTDADSSRPPPSSSSSKYPQTKTAAADIGEHAAEPIRTNSETESTASSKYAKRYVPACRAFITNFTSLIFERERGSVIIRRRSACPFLGPCTLPIQPTQRPVRTIPFRPSAAASVSARHFAPAHGYPQAIPNANLRHAHPERDGRLVRRPRNGHGTPDNIPMPAPIGCAPQHRIPPKQPRDESTTD